MFSSIAPPQLSRLSAILTPSTPRPDRLRTLEDRPSNEATLLIVALAEADVITLEARGFTIIPKSDNKNREVFRNVTTKRVSNPLDPSQYVDVEVIDDITFRNGQVGDVNYKLDNGE